MNFDFSDDQKLLRDQARRFLSERAPMSSVRAVLDDDQLSFDAPLWKSIAEMGWLGAAIPEAYGGLELGRLELCVLAEEMGRSLAPVPFSSTAYFFTETLLHAGSETLKQTMLPHIVSGEMIGAFAFGEGPGAVSPSAIRCSFDGAKLSGVKLPVTDGDIATHCIVLAQEGPGVSLVVVDLNQPGVKREALKTLDPTRGHARLIFEDVQAERIGEAGAGWDISERTNDRAAVLIAFEQIGGAQACLDMALGYAKERHAFSRQIGSFQAIKHKLADMYVAIEVARSNAYYGAWALSTEASELPIAAASARIAASDAFYLAAKENIQTHGGMGFTWEMDCHLFYRRAKLLAVQAGAPGVWKEKLVRQLERSTAA